LFDPCRRDNIVLSPRKESPAKERFDPEVGRVILKYLSDDYLLNDKIRAGDATDL
jgi:hypothetical protein